MTSTFPTNYVTWLGYKGTKMCLPDRRDLLNIRSATIASVSSEAIWLQALGTGTAALANLPTQEMKSRYAIHGCNLEIAGPANTSFVHVTYVTQTTTVTKLANDPPWVPKFPTSNGVVSDVNGSTLGLTADVATPPRLRWNISHDGLVEVLPGFEPGYDPSAVGGDFVKANQLDINPNISSYCSSHFASVYAKLLTAPVTSSSAKSAAISPQIVQTITIYGAAWPFRARPALVSPCCGHCSLTVSSVTVHYWPTPAMRDVTTTVNAAGYTL